MSAFRSVAGLTAIASEGVNVMLADQMSSVEQTAAAIQAEAPEVKVAGCVVDVSDEESVARLVALTVAEFGQLDIMANNAGIHVPPAPVWETEMADVDRLLAVNFKGIFHGCKYASRQMISQGRGTIVNTGSFFGKVGHAGSAAYGASKAAVHTLTMSLAMELAPYRVTVNALCPGLAATEMHWSFVASDAAARGISIDEMKQIELESIPLGRYGYGADMAGAIAWLASRSGSYVTGQMINVNGGLDFS
jgi:NAD(P)-dependent dehydrogenase (short-subunit alcohol dehydrogenase family)